MSLIRCAIATYYHKPEIEATCYAVYGTAASRRALKVKNGRLVRCCQISGTSPWHLFFFTRWVKAIIQETLHAIEA